jgi:glycosyltransferase involved in cell wall biosynthesis
MTDPLVSVVIPAYNTARTLPRALDSVFSQTFTEYEVIVVDDGSVDDVAAATLPYGNRVQLIRQNNAGASSARNNGVRHACGQYLAFLDADDFWHPRKLEIQVAAFRARPETALCWSKGIRWSEADLPMKAFAEPDRQHSEPEYVTDFREIFVAPYLGTPGVMMRRDAFLRLGGFREDLPSAEDIDLWLRTAYGRVVARIRAPLFFVVGSESGLTATQQDKTFKNNLRVIEEFCVSNPDFLRNEPVTVRRARAKVYENWGSDELVRGNATQACSLLARSLLNRATPRALMLLSKAMVRACVSYPGSGVRTARTKPRRE